MKRLISAATLLIAISTLGLAAQSSVYMATTRWVAAIAELAGIGQVENFAPSDMTHPPEYELAPADILKLSKAKVVFSAGYEGKMVKKINEALASGGSFKVITVNTDNSPENLKSQAEKIAKEFGTMDACAKNLAAYGAAVEAAKAQLKAKGLFGATALVHDYQTYLTKAFGFEIVGTFGPAAATPDQIAQAKKLAPAVIIDNYHNMVAKPLVEVSKGSCYVSFLNFPGLFGTSSIVDVVNYNAKQLLDAAPASK
jgi:ABC-type metal ion transport system, periplasmic component/surface adhesin